MWFDWKPSPAVDLQALRSLCPEGQYRVLVPEQLPSGMFSESLIAKTHSILVTCSGTDAGRVYMMLNLNRQDKNEIDQMPYGIALEGHRTLPSGVLVQHGDYHQDRTTKLPNDFYQFVASSGTYPLQTMPPADDGQLSDLKIGSQNEAFKLLVETIQGIFPETSAGNVDGE